MPEKLYDEQIFPQEAGVKALKSYMSTQLAYMNDAVDTLKARPSLSFRQLKTIMQDKIWSDNPQDILSDVFYNELYYVHKNFVPRHKRFKLLTDVQYMTFIVQGTNGKGVRYNPGSLKLRLPGNSGTVVLTKPLPAWEEEQTMFLNLSYSGLEDQFRLSIFKTPTVSRVESPFSVLARMA